MIKRALAATLLCWTTASVRAETGFGSVSDLLSAARLSQAPADPAAAQTPVAEPPVPQFCADPNAFVCGSSSGEDERKREIASEQGHLRRQTLEDTLGYVGIPESSWSEYKEADLATKLPVADRVRAHRYYFKRLRELVSDYLIKNDLPQDFGLPQLKANLKAAIAASTDFTPELRQEMAGIVDATRLISLTDYASGPELDTPDLKAFWSLCGEDGIVDNADSTQASGGSDHRIFLCPGYLIGSIQYAKHNGMPHELLLAGMTDTMGHEIGHQFDSTHKDFRDAYGSMMSLLQQNQLGLKAKTLHRYMSESTADLWGSRTLAVALAAVADPALRAKILVLNFADLCGAADDEIHPGGRFRIDVIAPTMLCR